MSSRTRRVLLWSRRFLAVVVTACAVVGAVRLVVPATAAPTGEPVGSRRQLEFLRSALDDGAGEEAQGLFPEGHFFLHALYGLSWVEIGLREPVDQRAEALREARYALERLESPSGRAPFSASLTPSHGVFYRGWSNWLCWGVLSLQPVERRDPAEVARFAKDSAALGAAFDASASPYLAAYPGQAWPVDSTVAMASLRLHDTLLPPKYAGTVERWLSGVRQRLDPRTGLLPHRADADTGDPVEIARGSSQSLVHRFLIEVDPDFARSQYLRFRELYVVSPLGLGPVVREYPDGVDGPADVDSGPLPLGVSRSASVVTLGLGPRRRRARRSLGHLRRTRRPAGRHPVDEALRVRTRADRRRVPGVVQNRPAVGGADTVATDGERLGVVAHAVVGATARFRGRAADPGVAAATREVNRADATAVDPC